MFDTTPDEISVQDAVPTTAPETIDEIAQPLPEPLNPEDHQAASMSLINLSRMS